MSTRTSNFNLIKPDLTDPADATMTNENWDKLDDELGKHNIVSYTALDQFDLSDDDLNPNDFEDNIDTIVNTLGDTVANIMLILDDTNNPNLYASVVAKLVTDTGINFTVGAHPGWLHITLYGQDYRPISIETNIESNMYYDRVWRCAYNRNGGSNVISAFTDITASTRIVTGTYTGNGAETRFINLNLGVTPRAVIVCCTNEGFSRDNHIYGAMAINGTPCKDDYNGTTLEITTNGFNVGMKSNVSSSEGIPYTNRSGKIYTYAVFI